MNLLDFKSEFNNFTDVFSVIFLLHHVRNNFPSEFSESFWKLIVEVYSYYCQPWQTFRRFTYQCVIQMGMQNFSLKLNIVVFFCNLSSSSQNKTCLPQFEIKFT